MVCVIQRICAGTNLKSTCIKHTVATSLFMALIFHNGKNSTIIFSRNWEGCYWKFLQVQGIEVVENSVLFHEYIQTL